MTKLSGGTVLRKSIVSKINYEVECIEYDNQLVQGSVATLFLKHSVSQQEPPLGKEEKLDFQYSNSQENRIFQIVSVEGPTKLKVKQISA